MISRLHQHVIGASLFLMLVGNFTFFQKLHDLYASNLGFVCSVTLVFVSATAFVLNLLCHGRLTKWVLSFAVLVASICAYFMDTYGTVIDVPMLNNMLQTNWSEATDLLSAPFFLRMLFLGVIPIVCIFRFSEYKDQTLRHIKSLVFTNSILFIAIVIAVFLSSSQYASFFREHKSVRFYSNPSYPIYSIIKLSSQFLHSNIDSVISKIAEDARIVEEKTAPKELMIVVVGETARADHFSLNGYSRETNPRLKKENVLSFKNVTACGTSTAISVPCMFSAIGSEYFSVEKAKNTMNALDVLADRGVDILWRDNNSDSKNVATRVHYEDFKTSDKNPVCDVECRDEGMLVGLDEYIKERRGKDVLIVLHQMGNHGPAYYKRYPSHFEKFVPTCKTNELASCSNQEIQNAYDNAILYTDYFLSKVIELLKRHDKSFETAMLYVSDHGESLGEYGMYLHGAPKRFAPREQTHVPAVFWSGQQFEYSVADLKPYENMKLSHDHLFCSLMVAYEVETNVCSTWNFVRH